MNKNMTKKLALTGLMAALCYIAFTFLKIPIPTPGGGTTAIHIGNAFCVLAALILGGVYGGLSGAIGMTIADLMDPIFITSAPKTFFLKFMIGLITGFVAHKISHIEDEHPKTYIIKWSLLSCGIGLLFNVFMDPIIGYLYKTYLLKVPADAAKIMATIAAAATLTNAVISTILATVIYVVLRPIIKRIL